MSSFSAVAVTRDAGVGLGKPIITVLCNAVRFSRAAAKEFNIYDYSHVELFVDIPNRVLGIKLINDGDESAHFRIRRHYTSKAGKTPELVFSANRMLRLLGLDFNRERWGANYHYELIKSDVPEVDFWINLNNNLLIPKAERQIEQDNNFEVTSDEISADPTTTSRFQRYNPHISVSSSRMREENPQAFQAPSVRVTKTFMTFNMSAIKHFNLLKKKGIEVFLDPNSNEIGFKFHEQKLPSCYTLTHHKGNKHVVFSWAGIFTRMGLSKGARSFMAGESVYLKLETPEAEENLDCTADMTPVVDMYGTKKARQGSMVAIKTYRR